jgi:AcrR family transcriptional regulator
MAWAEETPARQRPGKVAIMRAAVAVIGEVGYDAASVRDMAARAGVSVAALYYHFPSKSDLLREFLDEAWEVSLARIERQLRAAEDDPAEQLDVVVGTIIAGNIHDDFAKLASNVALRDYQRLDPPERASIAKKQRRVRTMIEKVLVAGAEKGVFTIEDPTITARAILTLTNYLAKTLSAKGNSKDEVIALIRPMARALATIPPAQ